MAHESGIADKSSGSGGDDAGPWKLMFERAGEQVTEDFDSLAPAMERARTLFQQENTTVIELRGPKGKRMTKEEIFARFENDL